MCGSPASGPPSKASPKTFDFRCDDSHGQDNNTRNELKTRGRGVAGGAKGRQRRLLPASFQERLYVLRSLFILPLSFYFYEPCVHLVTPLFAHLLHHRTISATSGRLAQQRGRVTSVPNPLTGPRSFAYGVSRRCTACAAWPSPAAAPLASTHFPSSGYACAGGTLGLIGGGRGTDSFCGLCRMGYSRRLYPPLV